MIDIPDPLLKKPNISPKYNHLAFYTSLFVRIFLRHQHFTSDISENGTPVFYISGIPPTLYHGNTCLLPSSCYFHDLNMFRTYLVYSYIYETCTSYARAMHELHIK